MKNKIYSVILLFASMLYTRNTLAGGEEQYYIIIQYNNPLTFQSPAQYRNFYKFEEQLANTITKRHPGDIIKYNLGPYTKLTSFKGKPTNQNIIEALNNIDITKPFDITIGENDDDVSKYVFLETVSPGKTNEFIVNIPLDIKLSEKTKKSLNIPKFRSKKGKSVNVINFFEIKTRTPSVQNIEIDLSNTELLEKKQVIGQIALLTVVSTKEGSPQKVVANIDLMQVNELQQLKEELEKAKDEENEETITNITEKIENIKETVVISWWDYIMSWFKPWSWFGKAQ